MDAEERVRRLARLFEAAEYQVSSRPGSTVAIRNRDHRAVVLLQEIRAPHDVEDAFPLDAIHRVIVYPQDPGPIARELAAERSMEVFDPSTLGPALGELLLGEWEASRPVRAESGEDGPLDAPVVALPTGERAVVLRVPQSEAERIVGEPNLRAVLRWVPFYVAPYRVREPSPHGNRGRTTDHLVAVHGLRRRAEIWEEGRYELTDRLEEVRPRFEPGITAEEAAGIATEWVRRHHTVRVDHTEQHGGTVVVETRRLPPRPEDVRLGPFAVLFVPFWYFEGTQGRVVLNAVTGERYRSDDDPSI